MSEDAAAPTQQQQEIIEKPLAELADAIPAETAAPEPAPTKPTKSLRKLCKEKLMAHKPTNAQAAREMWQAIVEEVITENGGTCDRANVYKAVKDLEADHFFDNAETAPAGETFTARIPEVNAPPRPQQQEQPIEEITPTVTEQATPQPTPQPTPQREASPEAIAQMQNLLGVATLTELWEEGTTALSQILNRPSLKKTRQTCERLAKIWQPVVAEKAPSLAQKPEYVAIVMTLIVFLPDIIGELKALTSKAEKPKGA